MQGSYSLFSGNNNNNNKNFICCDFISKPYNKIINYFYKNIYSYVQYIIYKGYIHKGLGRYVEEIDLIQI